MPALLPEARDLLTAFSYIAIDDEIVDGAMGEPDRGLRSLDAIHLATARIPRTCSAVREADCPPWVVSLGLLLLAWVRRSDCQEARAMAGESGQKFDHVVSVMFENRTFDNLLGRLYQPG